MLEIILATTLLVSGLTIKTYQDRVSKYQEQINFIRENVRDQVDLYNDLCAESRACDIYGESEHCTNKAADSRGASSLLIDAHHEGVKCASETILLNMDNF